MDSFSPVAVLGLILTYFRERVLNTTCTYLFTGEREREDADRVEGKSQEDRA